MNAKLSGFVLYVNAFIYLLLLGHCTFKFGSRHLLSHKQKQWPKKVSDNCYTTHVHLSIILVLRLVKSCHLNAERLVFKKM